MEHKLKVRKQEEKKQIISRLNRLEGQIKGVKKMIEEDRYCNDVLIQLSAIDKAIKSLANLVLDSHMHTCLIERVNSGDYEAIDEVVDLFKRFQ
jgi:DNA-binding FrmR family transcriptional regulator